MAARVDSTGLDLRNRWNLAGLVQKVGGSSRTPKGGGFDFQSRNIPRFRVGYPVGAHAGGNRLMFPTSMFLSPFL